MGTPMLRMVSLHALDISAADSDTTSLPKVLSARAGPSSTSIDRVLPRTSAPTAVIEGCEVDGLDLEIGTTAKPTMTVSTTAKTSLCLWPDP